jgi:phage/plasmid-like protein (TIGR03299 family)
MAHNIHGDSMAFAGEAPWHGIGQQFPGNATWAAMRAAAKFYDVVERNVFAAGNPNALPDMKALYRADTNKYLATVGAGYKVIQFDELADTGVKASGDFGAIWHTAGLLGAVGREGWMLGELPNPIRVQGDESEIRKYVLLHTSHGGGAARLKNVATRVVCQNTLGAAFHERGAEWTIRHTANAQERLADAAVAFREVVLGYERFGSLANELARRRFTDAAFERMLQTVIPFPEIDGVDGAKVVDSEHKATKDKHDQLRALVSGGFRGYSPKLAGTAWAAVQAFTEWADWHRPVRALEGTNPGAVRLESVWFGPSAEVKTAAVDFIRRELDLVPA